MIKTLVTCAISRSYLPGVTTAELQRHPIKMNVIESVLSYVLAKRKFLVTEKLANGALVTPTHGLS